MLILPPPHRRALLVAVLVLGTLAACGGDSPTATDTPEPPRTAAPSMAVEAYLSEIINVMQTHSVNRRTIDWPAFRSHVLATAGTAQTVSQAFPAITAALARLGDGHSSYRSPTGTFLFVPTRTCRASGAPIPVGLPPDIGYVRVGAFSGTAAQAAALANGMQRTLEARDRDSLAGWIVDLRGNGGGNMWPMLAGVGPVLGTGVVGWFIDPDGVQTPWEYRDGASWSGGFAVQRVDAPYTLRQPNPRVAVLVDNGVASSGEAIFIAFRGRPDTRSFGVATCGLSTANRGFPLSDGALLNLTVALMADRDKSPYGEQVMPDETIDDQAAVVQRAVEWLRGAARE